MHTSTLLFSYNNSTYLQLVMNFVKSIATLFCFVLITNAAWAQKNGGLEKKATEQVTELNTKLKAVDPALALTKEQEEKIYPVYLAKQESLKAINKAEGTEEEKKEQRSTSPHPTHGSM